MDIDLYSIRQHVEGHRFWLKYLDHALEPLSQIGIHIVIFSEPFLTDVLQGRKTVDSRFSRNRCAPYGEVAGGDIILIKEVSGPICGLTLAQQTWFFNLDREPLDDIKRRFADGICADAQIARRGGDPESREDLQNLGQSLVDSNPEMFCQAVLETAGFRPGDDLLVDGVRHTKIQDIISRLVAPSQVRLIYLTVDVATQIERVSIRSKGNEDFSRAEQHPVESELKEALPSTADAVLNAQEDLNLLVKHCCSLIDEWRETKRE